MENAAVIKRQPKKPADRASWRQFGQFFKKAKLSWTWIILALLVTIGYYLVVKKLPGSTAAVLKGDFSWEALKSALINYAFFIVLRVLDRKSVV